MAQHPGLFDREALLQARDLYEFDNIFTAPVHGFTNTEDYWARASAKPHLHRIRIPALVLNARNDPSSRRQPAARRRRCGRSCVTLWQPAHGGHVGFPGRGPFPAHRAGDAGGGERLAAAGGGHHAYGAGGVARAAGTVTVPAAL